MSYCFNERPLAGPPLAESNAEQAARAAGLRTARWTTLAVGRVVVPPQTLPGGDEMAVVVDSDGIPSQCSAALAARCDSALSPKAMLAADARADPTSAMVLAVTNGQGRARSTRASEA